MTRLLVVSRETAALHPLWSIVESNSWHLETAASPWEALERVQSGVAPHLLILDLPRGDGDSLHILRWLRRLRPELPMLLLCHAADANNQRDAIRVGANEVLIRPFRDEHLELAIYRHLARPQDIHPPAVLSESVEAMGDGGFFVSASPIMQRLRVQAELLAQTDVPVLILGEKGSGKQTVARLIHHLSVRSGFKFMKVNCADKPADLLEKEVFGSDSGASFNPEHPAPPNFEVAEKRTILFDELTEMSDRLQGRLLSALQDRHNHGPKAKGSGLGVDVRVLGSTSANIERALAEGKLRQDLYYRLSAFTVHVPPLRQRKVEIPILLQHFMHCLAKHYGLPTRDFSGPVLESCEKYWWPGNVGELEAFVKRYLIAGENGMELKSMDPTRQADANSDYGSSPRSSFDHPAEVNPKSLKSLIQDIKCETERSAIGLALEKTGWNRKAAARLLRVSYRTLLYKIEQYQMNSRESSLSPLAIPASSGKDKAS